MSSLQQCSGINSLVSGRVERRIILPESMSSPLKIDGWNMLEYYFPIGEAYFQERLLLVSGRVILKSSERMI